MQVATKEIPDADQCASAVPIQELGCMLVLAHALARPLPPATVIDHLRVAAGEVGWHPVGDVLKTALERCVDRKHLRANSQQRLSITEAGRYWLISLVSQRFVALPEAGRDLLFACQLSVLATLHAPERQQVLDAIAASRHERRRHGLTGRQNCTTLPRGWQDVTQARHLAECRLLKVLSQTP